MYELTATADPDEIDVVFDEQRERMVTSKNVRKRRCRIGWILFFLFVLLFLVVGVIALVITSVALVQASKGPTPPSYVHVSDIGRSVEYQIALNPKESWTSRSTMVDLWIEAMNTYSHFLHFEKSEGEENIYGQIHYNTVQHCGSLSGTKIRFREYIYSSQTGIDIKTDLDEKEDCSDFPYWCSEELYSNSTQKCEQDGHPCFSKLSRGTSIIMNNITSFSTCQDLIQIFPDAFPHLKKENQFFHFPKIGNGYWWKFQWKGIVGEYTRYQITFNVQYETPSGAISGSLPIIEGEWSLRFYTPSLSQPWEEDVFDDFQSLFYDLVEEFDVYEDHKECAALFADGEDFHGFITLEDQYKTGNS